MPTRPSLPRLFLWLLPLSLALQLAAIGLLHQYRVRPGHDHFEFGWEMGRVARSIAQGKGFSSPYEGNTGPTAWEPPLYPYLMAGVFKVFGDYSQLSAWVLLSINCLFATLTCIPIYWIAHRTFGERLAIWSAYRLGIESLCLVLVHPLDLGHNFHSAGSRLDISVSSGTRLCSRGLYATVRGPRNADTSLWIVFGALYAHRRPSESHHARLPTVLRAVDLAPKISAGACRSLVE